MGAADVINFGADGTTFGSSYGLSFLSAGANSKIN